MRPPGFPGNPPARMPRAPTPARSPPPRPLRGGDVAFRPTHDVGPRDQCISGLHHAAYALPVNASRPGSPQAHASLGSGWWPTLAGWDWIPTGFRTRFRRSHHGILSSLTGLSRHPSGRPGSLLTLAPHRSGRAGSAASGSSTDGFATRRRVPAGPGSQAMATAIPKAYLASSAIRCRDVETGPNLGVLAVFPSTGATCRCPLPSTGSRGLNSPASAVL